MFKEYIRNFHVVILSLFPFSVTSSIAMQTNQVNVDCHGIHKRYCELCEDPNLEDENDECGTLSMDWFNHCGMYGISPDCKTPMPPKTGMGKKENPDLKFLQKYYGTGYGTQIYTNKEKQKFLNFAKIIDQALSAYQERGEHDLTSDSNFVINTAKAIGKIAGLAAWEFREEDTNYQFTQYINEKLYPIYMEIYERHFPNLYGLREEIKDPQQMYQSIVNDIKKVAGQNDQLKKQMVEPVKCGYSMAQSMSARGIKGMFWFVPNSDIIFPLIHLYFDSWQLAKYNHTETEVFSMHEQACGHGTGIRAFIYFFAPQLAKALKKKLSKA